MADRIVTLPPEERRVSAAGIARHTVAILSAASIGAALLPLAAQYAWLKPAVFAVVAGVVIDGRRWQPAHVNRAPWWATGLAALGALGITAGCLAVARALGLPQATVASFRFLSIAVNGGLGWAMATESPVLNFSRAAERIEEEGAEVRARWTLPRPKQPLNAGGGGAKRVSQSCDGR